MYIGTFYSPSEKQIKNKKATWELDWGSKGLCQFKTHRQRSDYYTVIHCLLLVQPMKRENRPDITENLLTRM